MVHVYTVPALTLSSKAWFWFCSGRSVSKDSPTLLWGLWPMTSCISTSSESMSSSCVSIQTAAGFGHIAKLHNWMLTLSTTKSLFSFLNPLQLCLIKKQCKMFSLCLPPYTVKVFSASAPPCPHSLHLWHVNHVLICPLGDLNPCTH